MSSSGSEGPAASPLDEEPLVSGARLADLVEDAVVGTDVDFRVIVWNRGAERLYGYSADEVLGRDARTIASYPGDTSRLELEGELLDTDRTRTEITAYRKGGAPISVELIATAVRTPQGELAGYLGIHRDVTERRRAAADLEQSVQRQAAVAELGLHALASHDLEGLMEEAAAECARMLEAELVGVHELRAGDAELDLRAGFGWREGVVGSPAGVAGRASPMGSAVSAAAPVIYDDLASEARFVASGPLADHDARGAVCVVIEGRDEPFGVLAAFSTRPRAFAASDVDFVQAIANVLAAAVERASAELRLAEVRQTERRRIARDLHDEALQDLTVALARATLGAPAGRAPGEQLTEVVHALERIGRQLRGAIYDLRLGGEDSRPFRTLLEELVDVQRALADGSEIDLDVGEGVPTEALGRRGTEILRVVGEAIVNARRHAGARAILVHAAGSAHQLGIEIIDDGRGFHAEVRPVRAPGAGIDGMRERAAALHGTLEITSRPGAGTRVCLRVPVAAAPEAGAPEVRILLVDDHAVVREALATSFERESDFTVVGQAGSLVEAREALGEHEVDVAILDLGLPDGDGVDLIAELRAAHPPAQALILSAGADRARIARAIEHGAAATLDKTTHLPEIVDAVRRLRAGETLLAMDEVVELLGYARRHRNQQHEDREAIQTLTPRELEVLQALAEGLDTQAAARRLDITSRTQRNHVASILSKLGVHSQLQAVLFAHRYGVVELR